MTATPKVQFRLYVAGETQNSVMAIANLRNLCGKHLKGRCEIEIVDVFADPKRGLADNILMTPTLLKISPKPVVRIVGTLGDPPPLLAALKLPAGPS